ncbi:hypothetical protein B0T19DRAFT_423674 [Cercophora scortea]|uniref:Transcription initiation factor IIA subunit 2 n=1 Tax=Cercophora scortea TaxID=314031 RepID=A0AAE0INN3_9PEZI|nr:hypothetical protein B0T19DRAFT_423674 [Cercophora scortea]
MRSTGSHQMSLFDIRLAFNCTYHNHQAEKPKAAGTRKHTITTKMDPSGPSQLYRYGSLGWSLIDTLDELHAAGKMTPQLSQRVLAVFDHETNEAFTDKVRAKMSVKGQLHQYRLCDEIWTFHLRNVTFIMYGEGNEYPTKGHVVKSDRMRITCHNSSIKTGNQG